MGNFADFVRQELDVFMDETETLIQMDKDRKARISELDKRVLPDLEIRVKEENARRKRRDDARKARLERTRKLAEDLAERTGQPLESLLRKSLIETTDKHRAEGFDMKAAIAAEKACDDFGEEIVKFRSTVDITKDCKNLMDDPRK